MVLVIPKMLSDITVNRYDLINTTTRLHNISKPLLLEITTTTATRFN